MKMENEITAHRAGKVTSLNVSVGDAVGSGDPIATIE
ncbi:MAG TPA: acetyl-CoA carboxylase biotin carboxyl carrier protein subunit [Solirubrobacterales bacterium]|nr:acetyl-CoA carboxylase biotin carboxyl carrier protein subunit [Solirubrobacterales bacterium]